MTTLALPPVIEANPRLGDWLSILPDGRVLARTGKVEFGQGIRTALTQIVAHELRLDPSAVVIADVETSTSPDEGVTSGSRSVEEANEGLRLAAAELRVALIERAARSFGVEPAVIVVGGCALVVPGGGSVGFAQLAGDDLENLAITGRAELLPVDDASPLGASLARVDLPAKVFGRPSFVQDIDLPGMLHGRVCRPPQPGAHLLEVDVAEVESLPGVRAVVRDGTFLGVVADREEQAIRGLRRLRRLARWGPGPTLPRSASYLLEAPSIDIVVADDPPPSHDAGPEGGEIAAEYSRPYIAHASLGPSCAIAVAEPTGLRVWTHSQGVFHLRQELAKVFGLAAAAVEVNHREGAGCYGANGADDAALDAALLARAVPGTPVRVQWMRDDELRWEPFGTPMIVRLQASLDRDGKISRWTHDVWGNGHRDRPGPAGATEAGGRLAEDVDDGVTNLLAARNLAAPFEASVPAPPGSRSSGSGRNADPIYAIPSRRVVNHYIAHTPIRVSALRSLGAHANVFAIESFMDEIAARAGADPVEHRLSYLADPRAREVIERVARNAGWQGRAEPGAGSRRSADRGLGIGFARYKNAGAYVAVVAEVEIAQELVLRRAWAACDAGLVVNPDGLANQLEGGILQAASWTLREAVLLGPAGIESDSWTTYPILAFSEMPELHVEVIERPGAPPCGIGEAVAGPTAAAIANAIFAASGVRMRDMPFTRERFIEALA